ncbi:MAG: hybrid sensor histidine kinase/response regulator [Candidatus Kapaibacteriota bacterium]|jgi:two-component system sensor histidine kinase/response regulator
MTSILIIDDNKHIRTQINLVLKLEGYKTFMASNGLEGVQIAQEAHPSLVICDIMMPELDGYGVLSTLRSDPATADIPFLFLSAKAEKHDIRQGMNLGADDYLWKPFSTEDLIKAIQARLDRHETTRRVISQQLSPLAALSLTRDRFLSLMTHDLKSAFTGVIGLAELMSAKYQDMSAEEFDETLQLMNETVQSTYGLLDSFLEWSRLQIGGMSASPHNFDLHLSLLRVTSLLTANANNKKIKLHNTIPEETRLYADERMTEAILRNLLYNAVKFTNLGGTVTIRCQDDDSDKTMLRIAVEDTGIGISEEDIVRLLEPENEFTTLGTFGEKGTGLGVLFCRELAEKNGGTLRIESIKNYGSTFSFTLPKAR